MGERVRRQWRSDRRTRTGRRRRRRSREIGISWRRSNGYARKEYSYAFSSGVAPSPSFFSLLRVSARVKIQTWESRRRRRRKKGIGGDEECGDLGGDKVR